MKTNDALDFGQWTCPTSWDDINLKTYQEIERYYEDKDKKTDIREIVHILCGKTIDEVNSLPSEFLDIILEKLAFLQKSPEVGEPTNKIEIDGEEYSVNIMEKLKTGEYIQTQTIMKSDQHNYAGIMAVLCRKEGEVYDSKFEAEVLNERIKLFEQQPVINILPIIHFFMIRYMLLEMPSQLSSKIKEAINLTRSSIESSRKSGLIGKLSTRSVMRKLKKLEKTINSI